jgi:hypothetical protein
MKTILLLLTFLVVSCDSKSSISEVEPLTLIPSDFQVVGKLDVDETLKIVGLADRLRYEIKRKPTLQLIPIESVKDFYLASGSGKTTEEKGGIYIVVLKKATDLDVIVDVYQKKFAQNKEVITGAKKYKEIIIHNIRDRKQTLSACQMGPKTILLGPEEQVIKILQQKEDNIAGNQNLKEMMSAHQNFPLSVFMLSSKDSGSFLSQFSAFEQLSMSIKKSIKGADIFIESFSKDEEANNKTHATLQVVNFGLMYQFRDFITSKDIKIIKSEKATRFNAAFSNEALKEMFIKK